MSIFGGKNRIAFSLCYTYVFLAVAELFLWVVGLLLPSVQDVDLSYLYVVCFSYFVSVFITNDNKKALAASLATLMLSIIMSSYIGFGLGILATIGVSILLSKIIDKLDLIYGFVIIAAITMVVGVSIGMIDSVVQSALRTLCSVVSGKGALFGVVNNAYTVAFGDSFSDLFYNKFYSSSQLINGNIASGVIDIFSADTTTPAKAVARYMTGKYLVNIFLPIAFLLGTFSRFDDMNRLALVSVCALSILAGNSTLLSAFIFMFNPFLYLGYLFMVLLSYLIARFVDIRIGFINDADIVELFRYNHRWIYFILIGVVISAMTYFVIQLVLSKFDLDRNMVLPREVRRVVNALGGERNIERISNGKAYVKNPNLINILKLDCDIHENEVTLIKNDIDLLQEYF